MSIISTLAAFTVANNSINNARRRRGGRLIMTDQCVGSKKCKTDDGFCAITAIYWTIIIMGLFVVVATLYSGITDMKEEDAKKYLIVAEDGKQWVGTRVNVWKGDWDFIDEHGRKIQLTGNVRAEEIVTPKGQ